MVSRHHADTVFSTLPQTSAQTSARFVRSAGSTTCVRVRVVVSVTRGHRAPPDAAAPGLLTRLQVADRLGVSLSTVRRLERSRLPAVTGPDGVHRFDPAAVAELAVVLAAELAADPAPAAPGAAKRGRAGKAPRNAPGAPTTRQAPPADLPAGELAARVFERLDQRQSLAEIVVGLRVAPALVRELHREWQRGLVEGELEQPEPVLPAGTYRRARERFVDAAGLAALLAELPMGARTRISVARNLGDYDMTANEAAPLGWGELRRLVELGGFLAMGPIPAAEIARRYGAGDFRITAYGFDPPGVRWEAFATIDAERVALVAVELPPVVELMRPALPAAVAAPVAPAAPVAAELPTRARAVEVSIASAPVAAELAPAELAPVEVVAVPPDAAEPWGDGVVSSVLGGRGLRAELAAATLPPSSAAPTPASPLDTMPADWLDAIAQLVPRVREPDPPGLSPEAVRDIAHGRHVLASIPPVRGHALGVLQQRFAACLRDRGASVRVIDPGAPLWKAVRKRLTDRERPIFEELIAGEDVRRLLSVGGGNDPGAAVDAVRLWIAMSIAVEIEKHRGTLNVPAAAAAKEG